MSLKLRLIVVCSLFSVLFSSFAQDSESGLTDQSPTVLSGKVESKNKKNVFVPERATYFSIFTGPSLGGEGDPIESDGQVDEDGINSWNQVSFQWKLAENLNLLVNPRFSIFYNNSEEDTFVLEDPVVGIGGTWYKKGNFSYFGQLNTILPMARTSGTKDDGQVFNPGGFNILNYKFGNGWHAGSWVWWRARFYNRALESEDERLVWFVAPRVEYELNDSFSVSSFYWVNGEVRTEWDSHLPRDDHFGLMFKIALSKHLTLEPYLQVFRQQDFSLSKSNFIAWISGSIF